MPTSHDGRFSARTSASIGSCGACAGGALAALRGAVSGRRESGCHWPTAVTGGRPPESSLTRTSVCPLQDTPPRLRPRDIEVKVFLRRRWALGIGLRDDRPSVARTPGTAAHRRTGLRPLLLRSVAGS